MDPNEIMVCDSCGLTVIMRGVHPTWKGVPVKPNSADFRWFCREKEPCKEAFKQAVRDAEKAWSCKG